MKTIDLQYVKDTLWELDPGAKDYETRSTYNTALVVLSALYCGPGTIRLADFTLLPRAFVAAIRQRMTKAELWSEFDVHCDHWQPEEGKFDSVAFWLDALVAEGLVIRRWRDEVGDYWYCATEYARSDKEFLEIS
jgi:hypothetical protein